MASMNKIDTSLCTLHEPGGAVFQPPRLGGWKAAAPVQGRNARTVSETFSPFEAEREWTTTARSANLLVAARTSCYSGNMKSPKAFPFVLSTLCLSLTVASVLAADSSSLDALQGAWSTKRTNQEGQVVSQVLEFKQDRMTFK